MPVKKLKRGQKSPEASWRFLASHDKLRVVLYAQWKRSGMTMNKLAEIAEIATPGRIKSYFSKNRIGRLNEFQIVRLCEILKVEIDLDIKIVE